ncbi:MAG TPA: DUF2341 domain-containing protein, partial [Burkholderiales bacterium]|nr:DUF2341 domain-containing protein [Burkholderiales bacterium]
MKYLEGLYKSLRTAFASAKPDRERMLVEAIEPRILHSADISPLQLAEQGSGAVAEIRYLGGDGEFTQNVETVQQQQSRAVIFVDTETPDYQQLIDQIVLDSHQPDEIDIVLIDADRNGVDQISSFLFNQSDLSSVHIVSHGSDATVRLGQGVLDADFISENAGQISQWGDAFAPDADLLIYGCDVAGSDEGRALVDALARLTGADVAASDDLTGHAQLGGDWELEYRTGVIEAEILLDESARDNWLHVLPDLTIASRETVDADADGMIDHIKITLDDTNATLNDDFSGLSITVIDGAYTYALDASTPYVTSLVQGTGDLDEIFFVKLQERGSWDTGATPSVKVVSNSSLADGKDDVKTDPPGGSGVAATDAAAPVLVVAEANVLDEQSLFSEGDSLSFIFSETLSATPLIQGQLEVALLFAGLTTDGDNIPNDGTGLNPIALTTTNNANDTITVTFNTNNTANANSLLVATDTVSVTNGANIIDGAGNTASTTAAAVTIYGTPIISDRTTHDMDGDGQIDSIELTLSQAINDSTAVAGDFTVAGYSVTGFDTGSTANDSQLFLLLTESGSIDTGVKPVVTYTQGTLAALSDAELVVSDAVAATDGVVPRLIAKETADLNTDGFIDAIRLTFSEAMNDASFTAGDWDIGGMIGAGVDTGALVNDENVYITFTDGVLDTAATPVITYYGAVNADATDVAGNRVDSWWNESWLQRSKVTFDNSASSENLTDFAVLVTLNTTNLPGLDLSATAGADVRFVDADGTELKYEVESWDAATDTASVWVKVPQIDANSTGDFIWVYYDYDGTAAYDQGAADEWAVWNAEYVGLWHLNEATGVNAVDSITNANFAAPVSAPVASTGQIGGALSFAAGDQLDIAAVSELDLSTYTDWTISAWVNPTDYTGLRWPIIYSYGFYDASLGVSTATQTGTDGLVENWINDSVSVRGTTAATLNDWNHIAVSRDSATGITTLYLNGMDVGTVANTVITDSGLTSHIGGHSSDIDYQFLGLIDEVRVSGANSDGGSRSADWVRAEYLSASGVFTNFMASESWVDTVDTAAPVLMSSQTVDADSDGFIDAVRLTYSEAINDGTIVAGDWDVAGLTGQSVDTDTTANDAEFIITFSDGVLGTGATPNVTYTQNAIVDAVGNLAAGTTLASVDTAAPVLMMVAGVDAGASNVFSEIGDVLEFVFSETIAAAPTEVDSETNFVFLGVDGDNFPTEVGGDTIIDLITTNVANDTVRFTFSAGDIASPDPIISGGIAAVDVNAGSVVVDSIEDLAGLDLLDTATGAAMAILWRVGPVRDNDLSANAVDENALDGTTVGITAFAVDPNFGASVTYSLTDDAAGRFRIDSSTGVVVVNGILPDLNFEAASSHDITVRATSDDGSTSDQVYTINLNDVNEAPSVTLANAVTEIAQNRDTSARIQVADIVVSDDALGTNVLTLSGADAPMFEIDTGVLYLKSGVALSNATNPVLDVTVEIDDAALPASPEDSAILAIAVTPDNSQPSVSFANFVTTFPEDTDTTARVKVADIVITDDGFGTNVLSLAGADAALFEIDGLELFLKAGTSLDFETSPQLDVSVEVNDLTLPATPADSGESWWDSDWLNRRQITFDNSAAGADLNGLPILVRLTADDIDFGKILPGGDDIRFVDPGGTVLDYEIDSWDDGAETAAVWVRVPIVDGGSTTDYIHMYYNNAAALDGQTPTAVWPDGLGVYHLDEDPGPGLPGDIEDSYATPLPRNGQAIGMESADLVGGLIGDATHFGGDGSGDYIDFPSTDFGNNFTISAWVKPDSAGSGIQTIVANSASGSDTDGFRFFINTVGTEDGAIRFETGNGPSGNSAKTAAGVINFDEWNHVAVVVDRASGLATIYHNGADVSTDTTIRTDFNTSSDWELGRMESNSDYFEGIVDELRISDSARSGDWINASYLNQSDNSTFARLGGEGAVIAVTDANDAPTVDLDAGTGGADYAFTFTEGDGATTIVDATVTVADQDDTTFVNVSFDAAGIADGAAEQLAIGDLTFALNAGDFTNATVDIGGNAHTVNWVNATGVATVTLNSGEMSIAQAQTVMLATAYQHTDADSPTGGDRTIDVRVNDGDTDSAVATTTITVVSVNDNPSGAGALTATALNDNVGAQNLFGNLAITDVDAGENDLSLTITLTDATAGTISGGGFTETGVGTGVYTVAGLTVAQADTALDNVQFTPTDNTGPSGNFTTDISVTVNDQGGGGEQDVLTATTVTITRVNDNPSGAGALTTTAL